MANPSAQNHPGPVTANNQPIASDGKRHPSNNDQKQMPMTRTPDLIRCLFSHLLSPERLQRIHVSGTV